MIQLIIKHKLGDDHYIENPFVEFGTITYCPNRKKSFTIVHFYNTNNNKKPAHSESIELPCETDGSTRAETIELVKGKLTELSTSN